MWGGVVCLEPGGWGWFPRSFPRSPCTLLIPHVVATGTSPTRSWPAAGLVPTRGSPRLVTMSVVYRNKARLRSREAVPICLVSARSLDLLCRLPANKQQQKQMRSVAARWVRRPRPRQAPGVSVTRWHSWTAAGQQAPRSAQTPPSRELRVGAICAGSPGPSRFSASLPAGLLPGSVLPDPRGSAGEVQGWCHEEVRAAPCCCRRARLAIRSLLSSTRDSARVFFRDCSG